MGNVVENDVAEVILRANYLEGGLTVDGHVEQENQNFAEKVVRTFFGNNK